MSALAYDEYQPNVVYLSLVCPTCDADLDPAGPYVHVPPGTGPTTAFMEEDTRRLLRALLELIGTEMERHEALWALRRQRLRGEK